MINAIPLYFLRRAHFCRVPFTRSVQTGSGFATNHPDAPFSTSANGTVRTHHHGSHGPLGGASLLSLRQERSTGPTGVGVDSGPSEVASDRRGQHTKSVAVRGLLPVGCIWTHACGISQHRRTFRQDQECGPHLPSGNDRCHGNSRTEQTDSPESSSVRRNGNNEARGLAGYHFPAAAQNDEQPTRRRNHRLAHAQHYLVVLTALLILPFKVNADAHLEHKRNDTTTTQTQAVDVRERAAMWSLTPEDWARYEEIMAGPRGTWSPNLDPITALGIHARDEAERVRYANILARIEHHRLEQELAFERAYGTAFSALYGDAITHEKTAVHASGWRWYGRLGIDDASFRLVLAAVKRQGTPLEVFLRGASDDQAYREWAATQQIPISLVQSRQIVLQHDRAGHQPGLYGNLGGSWVRLDPLSGTPINDSIQ